MTDEVVDEIYKTVAQKIQGMEVSTVLPRLIQKMLTPTQAMLAAEFPGTLEDLAKKVKRDVNSVKKDLQYMYEIGIGKHPIIKNTMLKIKSIKNLLWVIPDNVFAMVPGTPS